MKVEPNDLVLFARVADAMSFSRAADTLGIPKSTVSRRLLGLERQLGERLILRSTRKLSLTDFGRGLLGHARRVAEEVEAATALALQRQAEPSGRLRVSMPSDFATTIAAPILARFIHEHPSVRLELDLSPRRVDLIGESFDLALRMGELDDDALLAARRVHELPYGLYASPAYLTRVGGSPARPQDLLELDSLLLLARSGEAVQWQLARTLGDGRTERWQGAPEPRCVANSPSVLLKLALAGHGIAALDRTVAESQSEPGALTRLLADWELPPLTAWAIFPGRGLMPAKTRAFIDALRLGLAGQSNNEGGSS